MRQVCLTSYWYSDFDSACNQIVLPTLLDIFEASAGFESWRWRSWFSEVLVCVCHSLTYFAYFAYFASYSLLIDGSSDGKTRLVKHLTSIWESSR